MLANRPGDHAGETTKKGQKITLVVCTKSNILQGCALMGAHFAILAALWSANCFNPSLPPPVLLPSPGPLPGVNFISMLGTLGPPVGIIFILILFIAPVSGQ